MAKCKPTNQKRFKALLLTLILLLVSCAYIFSACGTNDDDDDDENTTKTDTQTFANADFEYFDNNSKSYLIPTANSWSKSSGSNALGESASSSLAKSGIMDTSLVWSDVFPQAKKDYDTYKDTDKDDIPKDVNYYTDIDNDYDIPGWDIANDAKKDGETLTDDAIKKAADAANPGTHWGKDSDGEQENGTNVLMLHNYRSDREQRGTAAKYTSTSITLQANTAAKVSVWVKTYGMTDYHGNEVTADNATRGAYISLSNSVGGSSQDALFVNNINTAGVTDNNGWQQYTFYIKASNYASTSFSLVLGLGQGGGKSKLEYVDGYAFFDDVEYSVLEADEYDAATATLDSQYTYKLNLAASNDLNKKNAATDTRTEKVYALDLFTPFEELKLQYVTNGWTIDDNGNSAEQMFDGKLKDTNDDKGSIVTLDSLKNSEKHLLKEAFTNYPFDENDEILLISSNRGANYTAKAGNTFEVESENYLAISFWVKTSEMNGGTGATVTLRDAMNKTTIGAVDTTTLTGVTLKDDESKKEDIFDGWQQCYLFVENQTKSTLSFTLEFSYGPTTVTGTDYSAYRSGFAAFTGFEQKVMTEEEFNLKTTGTYAVSASLLGDYKSATVGGGFDDVAYAPTDKIETGFADTRNYDGVYGGSNYVGGDSVKTEMFDPNIKNNYDQAGLLNKAYSSAYFNGKAITALVQSYTRSATAAVVNADSWWKTILGNDVNQPLFITNPENTDAKFSYGYVAKSSSSFSASSYTTISYKVMLSEGAKAYLYLIDTTEPDSLDDARYKDTLNFNSGVSYRYDDNGNLVTKDPDDKDFSSKNDTLLYKQSNGLWAESKNYKGSDLYANLSNYEKDEDGNLTDVSDNIVYYNHDGKFYRYYDEDKDKYSVVVKDFKDAVTDKKITQDQLDQATVQGAQDAKLMQVIEGTKENAFKWITVTFYIANGDTAKNYRLEVWNGSRDGSEPMKANSFVIFDKVNGNALDADNYTKHLEENLRNAYPSYANTDKLEEAYSKDPSSFINGEDSSLVYYRYSLFDDSDYKPYDKNHDEDDKGDPYSEYEQKSYENTVAYFRYNTDSVYNTFVNFGAMDKTIESGSDDSGDSGDENTTDENQNVWLLISSIILAVILILTLIAMLVRKLVSNVKKGKKNAKNTYSAKRTHYMRKLKLEESQSDDDDNDILPDEDEIDEEDIYQVDEPDADDKSDDEDKK